MIEELRELLRLMPDHRYESRMFGLNRWATSSAELTAYLGSIAVQLEAAEGPERENLSSLLHYLKRELAWLEAVGL